MSTLEHTLGHGYARSTQWLGWLRISFCLYTFLISGVPHLYWIHELPPGMYHPPAHSIFGLLADFPASPVPEILSLLLWCSWMALLTGFYTPYSSLLTGILQLGVKGFIFSLGKIDHSILTDIIPLCLAFSGWGNSSSLDSIAGRRWKVFPQVLTLYHFLLGFGFFTAGIIKLKSGYLDTEVSSSLWYHSIQQKIGGLKPLLSQDVWPLPAWCWELADWLVVGLETLLLPALLWPRMFHIICRGLLLLHLGILLWMDINFISILPAYGFLLQFPTKAFRLSALIGLAGIAIIPGLLNLIIPPTHFSAYLQLSTFIPSMAWKLFSALLILALLLWSLLPEKKNSLPNTPKPADIR